MKMRGSQPWKTNRSRVLRSGSSSAEDWLWRKLRNRQLDNLKFVRQAPVGKYYADFLCRADKVIVEVDGGTHGSDVELAHDEARTQYLVAQGYRVLRLHNQEIYDDLEGVLDTVLAFVSAGRE